MHEKPNLSPLQFQAAEAYPDQDVAQFYLEGFTTDEDCGDTLFLFVIREANDAGDDVDELKAMLEKAIRDLEETISNLRQE